MSQRIADLYTGHSAKKAAGHITPTTEVYQNVKSVGHDRSVRLKPASTVESFNSFPQTHEIFADTSISSAFDGSTSSEVEFELPRNLAVINRVQLEFVVRMTSTASGDSARLRPGPLLLNEYALVFEGSTESITEKGINNHIYHLASTSDEEFERSMNDQGYSDKTNRRLGIVLGGASITGAAQTADHTFRIPIRLPGKLFAKAIRSPMIIRIRYNSTALDANVSGTPTLTLQGQPTLLVDEVQVDAPTERRLHAQYSSGTGVSFPYLETRQSATPFSVTADQEVSHTLSSHQGICPGTLFYVTPQAKTADNEWKLLDFKTITLRDETGTRFTHNKMDTRYLASQEMSKTGFPSHVNSSQADCAFVYIPHCLHFASAYHGICTGAFKYTSRERIDFEASTEMGTTGSVLLNIVTHQFAYMHVKNGQISFEK